MKRSLKFWTWYTWRTAGVQLMVVAIFSVLTIVSTSGLDWNLFISTVPFFLFVASVFCMILLNSACQLLYHPLLISMGETRRNVFFGSVYYRVLIIGVTLALCGLIWLICPGDVSAVGRNTLSNLLVILVAASSLGNLFGTIYVKWKWVGVMLLALTGGVIGGMSGVLLSTGIQLDHADVLKAASFLQDMPGWTALISVVLFAADLFFHGMLLRRLEVKL